MTGSEIAWLFTATIDDPSTVFILANVRELAFVAAGGMALTYLAMRRKGLW